MIEVHTPSTWELCRCCQNKADVRYEFYFGNHGYSLPMCIKCVAKLHEITAKMAERNPVTQVKPTTKLELAKQIIKENKSRADCGIFNTVNIVGDPMSSLYDDGELQVDICEYYGYFEVFGLSEEEFAELEKFYDECEVE